MASVSRRQIMGGGPTVRRSTKVGGGGAHKFSLLEAERRDCRPEQE